MDQVRDSGMYYLTTQSTAHSRCARRRMEMNYLAIRGHISFERASFVDVVIAEGCARLERHDSGRRHTGDALCAIKEKPQSNKTCYTATQVVQASLWRHTTRQSPKPLR